MLCAPLSYHMHRRESVYLSANRNKSTTILSQSFELVISSLKAVDAQLMFFCVYPLKGPDIVKREPP